MSFNLWTMNEINGTVVYHFLTLYNNNNQRLMNSTNSIFFALQPNLLHFRLLFPLALNITQSQPNICANHSCQITPQMPIKNKSNKHEEKHNQTIT
ncbi:hypothetical protein DM334_08170 [Salmonella enterica subsp. enterica serovar Newport]|nr:hypothetical protein [Salmonella enterica subsp. enterica serovar Newport]EBV5494464.1 hypothetical protein [Salmonella enterica subsp. enterica serovar Newport]ECD4561012.1 hypothetical protein [Salmonella enterica subsp. enterica serovar Newport]ECG6593980.1 hypothetical protein [Salmonella enterica subsp. enterica serovar Newport]